MAAPPASHSSVSLEGNAQAQHFCFYPRPKTRPGAIVPAYTITHRSVRNLSKDENNFISRVPENERASSKK